MAFVVVAKWTTREGKEDVILRTVEKMAEPSRAEEGCLYYQAHRDPDDSRTFLFYEQYVDEAAFQAHTDSPHFTQYVLGDAVPQLESRERQFYTTLDL